MSLALLLVASEAAADTVRVLVDRALIWSRPTAGVVLTQVSRDQELTVLRQVGDWYEVVLPGVRGEGSANAPTGFIRVSQAVVWVLTPNGPMQASIPSAGVRHRPAANFLNIDVGYRLGGEDLVHDATAFSDVYAEDGSISTDYGNGSGPQIDVMAGRYLTPKLALAGGFSWYQRTQDAHIEAEIPHPFYLNQLRPASFDASDLTGNELGIHISVLATIWETAKQRLSIFGGPSFFRVTQQIPTTLSIDESYPYDDAAISGVTATETSNASAVGFHVGADFTRFLGTNLGVGFAARYSRGSIDHDEETGSAGSAVVSGGLRFRF